jgi:hypothetical protein
MAKRDFVAISGLLDVVKQLLFSRHFLQSLVAQDACQKQYRINWHIVPPSGIVGFPYPNLTTVDWKTGGKLCEASL